MSGPVSLQHLAQALDGEISGGQVLAPSPGHTKRDRSLAVRPSARAQGGFIVYGFADGNDWRTCRDYVAGRLGITTADRYSDRPARQTRSAETRIEQAQALWHRADDPRGTVVERYLNSRCLTLEPHVAVAAIRYLPRCPWRDEAMDRTIFVPAMLGAMRSLTTRQVTAVHRTRLTDDGRKVDRRMLGVAAGTAIMLDSLDVSELVVGEGIETCLSAAHFGMRPVWALASAGAISAFPTLRGVTKLTLLGEHDNASETAITACHDRWHAAGCTVSIVTPKVGKDLNDTLRGRP